MKTKFVAVVLFVLMVLFQGVLFANADNPKGEEFVIADGKAIQNYPVISGHRVAWFESRPWSWGYMVRLRDLAKDETITISDSYEYLPLLSNKGSIYLNDKYCVWVTWDMTGMSTANFTRTRIFVYDISKKETTMFMDEACALSEPMLWSEYLFFSKKNMATGAVSIWLKRLNSKEDPKQIYVYNDSMSWNPYSMPVADDGYACWADEFKIYLYDINKDKLTPISDQSQIEYYPVLQNGIIYFNRLAWKSGWTYSIHGYDIKKGETFDLQTRAGQYWQRPVFNPEAYNFIFTEQYTENGVLVYVLNAYDPKAETVTEIHRFSYHLTMYTQCSDKDYLAWTNENKTTGQYEMWLCDLKKGEKTMMATTLNDRTFPRIDNKTIVWVDKRKGNPDVYGYYIK